MMMDDETMVGDLSLWVYLLAVHYYGSTGRYSQSEESVTCLLELLLELLLLLLLCLA